MSTRRKLTTWAGAVAVLAWVIAGLPAAHAQTTTDVYASTGANLPENRNLQNAIDASGPGDTLILHGAFPWWDGAVDGTFRRTTINAKTNLTLIFQPLQALIVAKAGATYCSPFLGRLDDIGHDGMALIEEIRLIYDNYAFGTEILAASLRHPLHVVQAAKAGADVGTIPSKVFHQMLNHPLTDLGLEKFLSDWKKSQG